jgi:hypothetical protein
MFDISSIMSTQAIPVFLIPLNGLLCSVFYTRFTNVSNRIHTIQKHIKELRESVQNKKSKHVNYEIKRSQEHLVFLHKRCKLILFTIFCLLISVMTFCICTALITVTLKDPRFFKIALISWFLGPFMILLSLGCAIYELALSLKSINLYSSEVNSSDKLEAGLF